MKKGKQVFFVLVLFLLLGLNTNSVFAEVHFPNVTPSTVKIEVGDSVQMNLEYTSADGHVVVNYEYPSENDKSGYSITENGLLTGLKAGEYSLKVSWYETEKPDYISATVKKITIIEPVQEIKTDKESYDFNVSEKELENSPPEFTVEATVIPDSYSPSYQIGPEGVIELSLYPNKFKVVGFGSTQITISAGKVTKTVSVNVTKKDVDYKSQFTVESDKVTIYYSNYGVNNYKDIAIGVPEDYKNVKPEWTSENEDIAFIVDWKTNLTNVTVGGSNVGSTRIHGKYDDVDIYIEVTVVPNGSPYTEKTTEEIKSLYDKYILPHNTEKEEVFPINYGGMLDGNYHLTEKGKSICLDYLNFLREISGSEPVTLKEEYNQTAQAGLDYLLENNLNVSHSAADNSDNELAKKGLHNSNLGQGITNPLFHLMNLFSDLYNVTPYGTGHRDNMLFPRRKEMGFASAPGYFANYVFGSDRSYYICPVAAYPAPGESPIEIITDFSNGVPIWSVYLSEYYLKKSSDESLKINITDSTGKSIDYVYTTNPDKTGNWYTVSSSTISINPYQLVDGNYKNVLNKTYTISIGDLKGSGKTLTYQTHFYSLRDALGYFPDPSTKSTYTIKTDVNPSNAGTVSGSGTFEEGETVTLEAKANSNYQFLNWTENGQVVSTTETYSFKADKDLTLTANFKSLITEPGTSEDQPDKPATTPDSTDQTQAVPIYRLYHAGNNEHLYTSDAHEAQVLSGSGWTAEGVGWNSPASGEGVYRLYHGGVNEHLYTKDTNEVNTLKSRGWTVDNNEKPLFYSGGDKPIYRLYHEGTRRHHLTTDLNEYNTLGTRGWNKEDVALKSLS